MPSRRAAGWNCAWASAPNAAAGRATRISPPPGWARPAGRGAIAALADGVGGAKGGRVAAELAVRGLIDGLLGQSEALGVRRTAGRAIEALNGWIHAKGRTDPDLAGMGCTLTAVVLRGRRMHVLHVGDSRLYRFRDGVLARLTTDHAQPGANVLTRAIGAAESVRVDYAESAARPHDRLLLCSDGIHGGLSDARAGRRARPPRRAGGYRAKTGRGRARHLGRRQRHRPGARPAGPAGARPRRPGSGDRCAAHPARRRSAAPPSTAMRWTSCWPTAAHSRVFRGRDTLSADNRAVVLKFPKPGTAAEASFRQAYLREGWIAARIRSPYLGEVLEPPPERASCLYAVMPFYGGETLERRILRGPPVPLVPGLEIATGLCKAVAALHRAGVIHRDIKPDNVILQPGGGLRLIDLGVARLPQLEEFAAADIPGTPSFMAPELLAGTSEGDERSDLYALGVTLYRLFSRRLSLWGDRGLLAPALRRAGLAIGAPPRPALLAGPGAGPRRGGGAGGALRRRGRTAVRAGTRHGRRRPGPAAAPLAA